MRSTAFVASWTSSVVRSRVAAGRRARDAVLQVLVEQVQADTLQRLADGCDLGEDVDAVGVLVDHPLQATDLALDAAQPGEDLLLVVGVSGCRVHAITVPPRGICDNPSRFELAGRPVAPGERRGAGRLRRRKPVGDTPACQLSPRIRAADGGRSCLRIGG